MASIQQLEEQIASINAELRVVGERLQAASSDLNSPEFNRLLEERGRLQRQRGAILSQITAIRIQTATQNPQTIFVVIEDPATGGVQIRTSDGLLMGRGGTLAEAKEAAIRNGVSPSALNNLVDPRAKAQADQGPGTESAGETVAEAQEAKDNGASSQSPADPAQKANAQGDITTAAASTVPSNADPATGTDSISSEAPNKLPEASLTTSNGSLTNDAGTGPVSTVLQVTTPDISAPEANNNLVSYIYRATRVVSRFQQGKFTQEIEGFQIFFPSPGQTNTAGAPASNAATAPNAASAATAPARPQTTVAQTATTPGALGYLDGGVTFQNQVGAEFGAFFGDGTTGEPGQRLNRSTPGPGDRTPRSLPGSSFAAEGFVDPTQEQPDTVAPLKINPPTTAGGSVVSPPGRSRSNANRDSQSNTTNTALQQGAREY